MSPWISSVMYIPIFLMPDTLARPCAFHPDCAWRVEKPRPVAMGIYVIYKRSGITRGGNRQLLAVKTLRGENLRRPSDLCSAPVQPKCRTAGTGPVAVWRTGEPMVHPNPLPYFRVDCHSGGLRQFRGRARRTVHGLCRGTL